MIEKVKILEEEILRVQQLFYEYNATLNILDFLMREKKDELNEDYLNDYFKKSELYYIKLEILKEELNKKYKPDSFKDIIEYNYFFNFDNNMIIYKTKEDKNE